MLQTIVLLILLITIAAPSLLILVQGFLSLRQMPLEDFPFGFLTSCTLTTIYITLIAIPIAFVIGFIPAWITHRYHFAGRRLVSLLHIIPICLPAYLTSGIFLEFSSSPFFESLGALSIEIAAANAGFVFLLTRVALNRIAESYDESGAALGASTWQRFLSIQRPLLTPVFLSSAAIIAAACTGDYDAASRVGITNLSIGIHDLWFGFGDKRIALVIIAFLLIVGLSLAFLLFRKFHRISIQNTDCRSNAKSLQHRKQPSSRANELLMLLGGVTLAIPGALAPLYFTISWAIQRVNRLNLSTLFSDILNSILTSGAVCTLCFLFVMATVKTIQTRINLQTSRLCTWISLLNFFLPSLTLGLVILLLATEGAPFAPLFQWLTDNRLGIVLTSALKFLPFLLLPVVDTLYRMPAALDESARSLGVPNWKRFWQVRLPYLSPSIRVGLALLFLLSMQELTLNQLLQPFGYSTISIRIYNYAGIHQAREASVWVLAMLIVCFRPLISLLSAVDTKS